MTTEPQYDALEGVNIDELIAHPYWEQIDAPLHDLIMSLPAEGLPLQRTTLLSWMYQSSGVLTFNELATKIQSDDPIWKTKRFLRVSLRAMQRIHLLTTVNFTGELEEDEAESVDEDQIGRHTLVSITWTGMIWLRRAWTARMSFMSKKGLMMAHEHFCEEEDEDRAIEPYWVESINGQDPEVKALAARAQVHMSKAVNSVFQLGALSND